MISLARNAGVLLWLSLVAAFLTPGTAPAQGLQSFEMLEQSRFWINGTSTVNSFTCVAKDVRAEGRIRPVAAKAAAESAEDDASLRVPVQHFDCGHDVMSRDLKETLEADAHPHIQFRLHEVTDVAGPDSADGWYQIEALGYLTVAGTERLIRVSAHGRPLDEAGRIYRVTGCKSIRMTYFGIDPPTKFLNVIKVRDRIEVHFDLVVDLHHQRSTPTASISLSNPPTCND